MGVDWHRRRICLVADKTSIHREVLIRPLLYRILMRAYGEAHDGTTRVLEAVSRNNLTRIAKQTIRDAGLSEWHKTFQAMRSSCENDWKVKGHAEATYAKWVGHDPTVSRKNYVAPTDQEYARVTGVA